jgi:FkbM family methyltransferase
MFDRNLIFDFGLHSGMDSRFYLNKGFRVVGLEANPRFCIAAREEFARDIADDKFRLVEKALSTSDDSHVTFFVRDDSDGWSSLFKDVAERDGRPSHSIEVATTTTSRLFDQEGVPYYIKCDIEGADRIFLEQLTAERRRPPFVSVEIDSVELLELLRQAGYDRFQIVDQSRLKFDRPPRPAREGRFVDLTFTGEMSGLFGRELEPSRWSTFEDAVARIKLWKRLPKLNPVLEYGLRRWGKLTKRGWLNKSSWLDVHATTKAAIEISGP